MATNSQEIKVSGFKLDGVSFQLPADKDSMTIDEISKKYSLPTVGVMFLLNGEAIGSAVAKGTVVKAGDTLEVARAAKGGRY